LLLQEFQFQIQRGGLLEDRNSVHPTPTFTYTRTLSALWDFSQSSMFHESAIDDLICPERRDARAGLVSSKM
jgi:hypothetical protein